MILSHVIKSRKGIPSLVVLSACLAGCASPRLIPPSVQPVDLILNDVHSRLNPTRICDLLMPESTEDVANAIHQAESQRISISISGGRHAMGGQQFGTDTLHISTQHLNRVLEFDPTKGTVTAQAGITWPELMSFLEDEETNQSPQWAINQKQTGANNLTLGGTLSSNAHGRGLQFRPIIQDVIAFELVDGYGAIHWVSRFTEPELFKLAIGGYGLFGVITKVQLQLTPRLKLKRDVRLIKSESLLEEMSRRISEGHLYGDFQLKTDDQSSDFLKRGILSTYYPATDDEPLSESAGLSKDKWHELLLLAHTQKRWAFDFYSEYLLKTNGQVTWSDSQQLSTYDESYIDYLKKALPNEPDNSLMITEVYVPVNQFESFIERIQTDARRFHFDIIYSVARFIRRDDESFLAWAKQDSISIIFNLRVYHDPAGLEKAKENFQRIIDRALDAGGSYYLTYHRWARKDQILKAYPQFPEFLRLKKIYDPNERFQSDWYRVYRDLFADDLN